MECILKILRLYLFRMNCDILLVFAFGFIRECHFKASSIKQRTQIPVGKILCVFITTIFCDFCFRMRSHAKRKNFIMGCIMGLIMGCIMGCVVGTNLFNSDWRQWNDGAEHIILYKLWCAAGIKLRIFIGVSHARTQFISQTDFSKYF